MGWVLLFVAILIVLIILAIHYWHITLALGVIGTLIYLIVRAEEKRKRREAAEAARREKQQNYRSQMISLGEESISLFESMPERLSSAERYLDQADIDFADGAFVPFWDSIENAAKALARFDEGVHHTKDNSSKYRELLLRYDDTPPQFPLGSQSVAKLGVATAIAERMKTIVRAAQCNYEFTTIYEQRKTNQILVAGFTNLAQALDRMTCEITESIDNLRRSVVVTTSTLNDSLQEIRSGMGEIAEKTTHHYDKLVERGAVRERKALEMLDNIQRGRRPSP